MKGILFISVQLLCGVGTHLTAAVKIPHLAVVTRAEGCRPCWTVDLSAAAVFCKPHSSKTDLARPAH